VITTTAIVEGILAVRGTRSVRLHRLTAGRVALHHNPVSALLRGDVRDESERDEERNK
jgi:hypothetical protein